MSLALKRFHRLYILFLIVSLSSCYSVDKDAIENLQEGKIYRLGHGGLGFSSWIPFNPYPINSYTAFDKALSEYHAEGLEADVHMTADNQFVLFHDDRLEKQTNLEGCIADKTLEELLQAKYTLGPPFDWIQSEKIISLELFLSLCKKRKEFPILHFDLRSYSVCFPKKVNDKRETDFMKRLNALFIELEIPKEKVLLISTSIEVLRKTKEMGVKYPLSFEITGDVQEGIDWMELNDIKYLTIKRKLLTKEWSAYCHERGIEVITFGAKSKSGNKKLIELNPDYIQTNNLEALNSLLD